MSRSRRIGRRGDAGEPAVAAASCDVPLPIIRTVGEAKVLIVFDTSGSMNEAVYHDDYDETVA